MLRRATATRLKQAWLPSAFEGWTVCLSVVCQLVIIEAVAIALRGQEDRHAATLCWELLRRLKAVIFSSSRETLLNKV